MKKLLITSICAALVLSLAGCTTPSAPSSTSVTSEPTSTSSVTSTPSSTSSNSETVEAVATASVTTGLYTNMTQAEVLEAMGQYKGLCNLATVNADGTANLAIFVPGVADENHIMFGWAENATKTNVLRDKKAVLTYDVANPAAAEKTGRHAGAVLKLELEEDEAVLTELKAKNEKINDTQVIFKIVEVLPIG